MPSSRPAVLLLAWLLPTLAAAAPGPQTTMVFYGPDPRHPWNRLYPLLFPGGEDISVLLQPADLRFLLQPEQQRRVLAALEAARAVPPQSAPRAAVLLQNDLWQRFDALGPFLSTEEAAPTRTGLVKLRQELAHTIAALGLPGAVLRTLPTNLPAVVGSYPDLLEGLGTSPDWVEVVTNARDNPAEFGGRARDGSRHAQGDGYRSVFRRFVRVPQEAGGPSWLRQQLGPTPDHLDLPPGSRVVLMQTPLALSAQGVLVPVPLVTLVEARVVTPEGSEAQELLRSPFHVLEGRRSWLSRSPPLSGGLERLSAAEPLPLLGTCLPGLLPRAPLRSVCRSCHGPRGQALTGTMSHGEQRFRVLVPGDDQLLARRSIEEKQASAEFRELLLLAGWR